MKMHLHCFSAIICLCAVIVRAAMEDVTVTVTAGERQEFKGFGVGQLNHMDRPFFFDLPEKDQDGIYRFLFEFMDLKYIRVWSLLNDCPRNEAASDYCAKTEGLYTKVVYDLVKKYQPDCVFLFGPWNREWLKERIGDLRRWAAAYAYQLRRFHDMGMHFHYSGIANEPDNHDLILDYQVPILIKYFREEFDKQGLQHVKIIAPENTSADEKARRFVLAAINDPDAIRVLDGFATHSYNTSITEEMEEIVAPYVLSGEKEYWMTECSDFGPEEFGSMWRASAVAARAFADLNHLCNVWIFYQNIRGMNSAWGGDWADWASFHLISVRREEKDWRPLLKCYYLKEMGRIFRPGTVMRKAYTDLKQRNPDYYWRAEDSTMVYAGSFGEGQYKAPLYLAAGVYNGSWRIGMTNYSGNVPPEPFAILRPERQFRVKVVIEELAGSGEVRFKQYRTNNVLANPADPHSYVHDEGTVVMRDGELVVDSLGSFDLITLESIDNLSASRRPAMHAQSCAIRVHVQREATGAVQAVVNATLHDGEWINGITISDLRGRQIARAACSYTRPGPFRCSVPLRSRGVCRGGYVVVSLSGNVNRRAIVAVHE